jgi:hypothetical protein
VKEAGMKEREEWKYEPPSIEDLGTLEEITGSGMLIGLKEGLALKT